MTEKAMPHEFLRQSHEGLNKLKLWRKFRVLIMSYTELKM